MTVKSLTPAQKQAIGDAFRTKEFTLSELCGLYSRSRRTLIRTLEEMGCDPGIKKRRGRKSKYVTLAVTIPVKTPWWRRLLGLGQKVSISP